MSVDVGLLVGVAGTGEEVAVDGMEFCAVSAVDRLSEAQAVRTPVMNSRHAIKPGITWKICFLANRGPFSGRQYSTIKFFVQPGFLTGLGKGSVFERDSARTVSPHGSFNHKFCYSNLTRVY